MALTATAFSAQAQTTNICDRTRQVRDLILSKNQVTTNDCTSVSTGQMTSILLFNLNRKNISSLKPGDFAGLTGLADLGLSRNQLRELPDGIFSGLNHLHHLNLEHNPGATFKLMVKFEPETLDRDFTTASVKLVLREGAPRPVTVTLEADGGTLSGNSLSLAVGNTQSAAVTVTRAAGGGVFKLRQSGVELGKQSTNSSYRGFDIVQGPPIIVRDPALRIRVFLEGALE